MRLQAAFERLLAPALRRDEVRRNLHRVVGGGKAQALDFAMDCFVPREWQHSVLEHAETESHQWLRGELDRVLIPSKLFLHGRFESPLLAHSGDLIAIVVDGRAEVWSREKAFPVHRWSVPQDVASAQLFGNQLSLATRSGLLTEWEIGGATAKLRAELRLPGEVLSATRMGLTAFVALTSQPGQAKVVKVTSAGVSDVAEWSDVHSIDLSQNMAVWLSKSGIIELHDLVRGVRVWTLEAKQAADVSFVRGTKADCEEVLLGGKHDLAVVNTRNETLFAWPSRATSRAARCGRHIYVAANGQLIEWDSALRKIEQRDLTTPSIVDLAISNDSHMYVADRGGGVTAWHLNGLRASGRPHGYAGSLGLAAGRACVQIGSSVGTRLVSGGPASSAERWSWVGMPDSTIYDAWPRAEGFHALDHKGSLYWVADSVVSEVTLDTPLRALASGTSGESEWWAVDQHGSVLRLQERSPRDFVIQAKGGLPIGGSPRLAVGTMRRCAFASAKGELAVYDWDLNEVFRPNDATPGCDGVVWTSPDALVTGHRDGTVRRWEIASGKHQVLERLGARLLGLCATPEGGFVAQNIDRTVFFDNVGQRKQFPAGHMVCVAAGRAIWACGHWLYVLDLRRGKLAGRRSFPAPIVSLKSSGNAVLAGDELGVSEKLCNLTKAGEWRRREC